MKSCKFSAVILLLALAVSLLCAAPVSALADPDVSAPRIVLADPESGEVFFCRNETERAAPASLTKIMTVLLAAEAIERGEAALGDNVMASSNITYDLLDDGSTAGITAGEVLTLENLLQCALVASANEACNIIAEHICGSIPVFIDRMNARAAELGCADTHFANTHGLPNEDHYTTAWDMFLISREALSHDIIARICGMSEITVPATEVSPARSFKNTNALLGDNDWYKGYYYEGASGVKTGHTNAAGYCLVATASRGDINLLSVVMGASAYNREDGSLEVGSFKDTITLFDWVFNNYSWRDVLRTTEVVADIPVEMGETDMVSVRPQTSVKALLPNDFDLKNVERMIVYTNELTGEPLTAPLSAGDVLGDISIYINGKFIERTALVATKSVALSRMEYIRSEVVGFFHNKIVRIVIAVLLFLILLYLVLVVRYYILRQRHLRSKRAARKERDRRAAQIQAQRAAAEEALPRAPQQQRRPAPSVSPQPEQRPAQQAERLPQQPPAEQIPQRPAPAPLPSSPQPEEPALTVDDILSEHRETNRDYYDEFFNK